MDAENDPLSFSLPAIVIITRAISQWGQPLNSKDKMLEMMVIME